MAAPKGNEFWKLRSEHGRDKLFETPELMWKAACEYFKWCVDHPKKESILSAGKKVTINKERVFTMQGLCRYLHCNPAYFRQFKDGCSEDFTTIIEDIEGVVYQQKFEGAASGFFKENLIARSLGLHDAIKSDNINRNVNVETTMEDMKKYKEMLENEY